MGGAMGRYEEIKRALAPIFRRREEVIAAYLFGSTVMEITHNESDVDIAVLVDEGKKEEMDRTEPYGYEAGMVAELSKALGTDRVDLVVLNGAPPLLAHQVISKGKLLFSRDDRARTAFEVRTKLRYLDTKPLREIQRRYLYRRIRAGKFSQVSDK